MTRALARTKPERGSKDDIPWYGRAIERGVPWLIRNVPPRAWLALPLWIVAVLLVSALHVDARSVWPLAFLLGAAGAALLWWRARPQGTVRLPMDMRLPRRLIAPSAVLACSVWLALTWWRGGWLLVLLVPLVLAAVGAMVFGPRRRTKVAELRHRAPNAAEVVRAWPRWRDNDQVKRVLAGSTIRMQGQDQTGFTVLATLAEGHEGEELVPLAGKLEALLQWERGSVTVTAHDHAHRAYIRVRTKDVLAAGEAWPGPCTDTVLHPIRLGTFETGEPMELALVPEPGLGRSVLVAGQTGAGKSSLMSVLVASLAGCRDVELYGIDPARVDLRLWRSAFVELVARDGAGALLERVQELIESRLAMLERENAQWWVPSPERKEAFLVVDEAALLLEHMAVLTELASQGRKAGVHLILATQRPSQQSLGTWGTTIRSQLPVAIGLRLASSDDCGVVFGRGAAGDGWRADRICRKPGEFLIQSPDHTEPMRARSYRMEDAAAWAAKLAGGDGLVRA